MNRPATYLAVALPVLALGVIERLAAQPLAPQPITAEEPHRSVTAPAPVTATPDLRPFGIEPDAQPAGLALPQTALTGAQPVYWQNQPIPITLQVGVERQITFPAGVKLGLPAAVTRRLRTQSVDGTVHWLAHEPFETQRVQVRETRSGRTYLLDVRALGEGGEVTPLEVIDAGRRFATPADPAADWPAAAEATAPAMTSSLPPDMSPPDGVASAAVGHPGQPFAAVGASAYSYPQLARFAYQQLYAPERLLSRLALPGISRVPVRRRPLPLYRGGALHATPLVSWTDGTHYVTAVELRNRTRQTVWVDPRELRGRWLARGVLASELLPTDDRDGRDRAAVVLISPVPFAEAVR